MTKEWNQERENQASHTGETNLVEAATSPLTIFSNIPKVSKSIHYIQMPLVSSCDFL